MKIKVDNLKEIYEALKELCNNYDSDHVEIYKKGSKLLPKVKSRRARSSLVA